MRYYTQLIFIKPGSEAMFHEFEDAVLPLLARHGGRLLFRAPFGGRRDLTGVILEDRDSLFDVMEGRR